MKKRGISILFLVLLSVWLYQTYKWNYQIFDWKQVVVKETKDVSFNEFLGFYNSWDFVKIELIDNQLMKWYKLVWKNSWNISSMLSRKTIQTDFYNIYQTNKSVSDSLQDLGFSMTWSTLIDIKNTKKTAFQYFMEQAWLFIILIIWAVILFKFVIPKWWLPFGFKVGKMNVKSTTQTKFSDVAWMEEVKAELMEIVDYLKNPEKYDKVGARHPKWVLLYGQPWSWKTLLARAVAWESDVVFFSASWTEFMQMIVWLWANKVRELFMKAKTAWKAIIFIDEIDAVWRKRVGSVMWWHQASNEEILTQILTEMDWFDKNTNIVVLAATNRPDILDPALLRAWRFDRKIYVAAPTLEERVSIFEYYLKWKKIDWVDISSLAKRTTWLVWADIENIVNEASIKIAKESRDTIQVYDFEYALEKVLMWPEKKIKSILNSEKKIISYHELWHAITANNLENADPVEKISIVSRWRALGVTWTIPNEEKYLYSKVKFLDELVTLLWWRACEEVFFWKDEITTWASNDFEKATEIAKNMIIKYWMDDDIWMVYYYSSEYEDNPMFKPYSEKTSQIIDEKVRKYLDDSYQKSKEIIQKNKNLIEKMSQVLLEKEYLSKEDFLTMVNDPSKIDLMLKEAIEYKNKINNEKLKIKN